MCLWLFRQALSKKNMSMNDIANICLIYYIQSISEIKQLLVNFCIYFDIEHNLLI